MYAKRAESTSNLESDGPNDCGKRKRSGKFFDDYVVEEAIRSESEPGIVNYV